MMQDAILYFGERANQLEMVQTISNTPQGGISAFRRMFFLFFMNENNL